jgi:peptidoglycan L-alanyl-D-glutamate endopeptidase CwlK
MNEKPISSRKITDLHPSMRTKAQSFVDLCKKNGIDILIYCTLRNNAAQAELYARGRSVPGGIVTNARPGESMHNYGMAFDCVPLVYGKPDWTSPRWPDIGRIGEECGMAWAGRWTGKLRETAHFETKDISIADLKAGKRL